MDVPSVSLRSWSVTSNSLCFVFAVLFCVLLVLRFRSPIDQTNFHKKVACRSFVERGSDKDGRPVENRSLQIIEGVTRWVSFFGLHMWHGRHAH